MKNLDFDAVVQGSGGVPLGVPFSGEITGVTIDSRTAAPGCLFAAIRGARSDGHMYIDEVFRRGGACVLAERAPEGVEGCVIQVPDTVLGLQGVAALYRKQFAHLPLLGVSGSVGKTTAKEMAAAVLARRFLVHKTAGNYNNDLGVALTLLGLRQEHEAAVVELGISHPGDMVRIAAAARPTMALYTAIGDAHLEFLGSRAGVLREKTVMNRFLPPKGKIFYNGDDPLLAAEDFGPESLSFGLGKRCAVRAEQVEYLADGGTRCAISGLGLRFQVTIPAYGEHMVYAALAGAAVGLSLGLAPEEIAGGIGDYVPVGRRARLVTTSCLRIIDDCYNANPTSVAAALRSLAHWEGRRVAILGDMQELGDRSAALHRETGELAAALGIDLVLAAGPLSRELAAGAAAGSGAAGKCEWFSHREALAAALQGLLKKGDTVLVKASRSQQFEEITAMLEALRL